MVDFEKVVNKGKLTITHYSLFYYITNVILADCQLVRTYARGRLRRGRVCIIYLASLLSTRDYAPAGGGDLGASHFPGGLCIAVYSHLLACQVDFVVFIPPRIISTYLYLHIYKTMYIPPAEMTLGIWSIKVTLTTGAQFMY